MKGASVEVGEVVGFFGLTTNQGEKSDDSILEPTHDP